jgi:hypothetical protein
MNGVINRIRTEAESSVARQQELFRKWIGTWPGVLAPIIPFEDPQKFQARWMEVGGELLRKQNESLEAQFKAGLRTIEEALQLAEAKDPEELRNKAIKLWQKTIDGLCQTSAAQIRSFNTAVVRWTELMSKGQRPAVQPFRPSGVNETKTDAGGVGKVPSQAKTDQEELEEAMTEYEMTRGDWSKGH